MKWENKTYECVRLLRPPASHVDLSDMEASTGTETESSEFQAEAPQSVQNLYY